MQSLGYKVYGPVKRDGAIVYDTLRSGAELPVGWQDEQAGGHYRLTPTGDASLFSYVVGPDSWKKYLFPRRETVFTAKKVDGVLKFESPNADEGKRAFFGVRPCELHGIAVQDRVFIGDQFVDPGYAKRRNNLLLVAVNCTRAADTCFCVSLDTGPKVKTGFDLALTEVINDQEHYFTLEVGSEQGAAVIEGLGFGDADTRHIDAAEVANQRATKQQRSLNTKDLKERFYANMENEGYWADVAARCLSCANCTMVCPTCFCSTVEDVTDLSGQSAERVREWDSCFNQAHSHIAGGSVRQSGASRYRQWITHKLASWQDQFDSLGCVGCGRCITWCPVGIDITAEAQRLHDIVDLTGDKPGGAA